MMAEQKSWASLVPKYTFGETLEEQEAQLATNPLLARFAESRAKLAADPYRPLYHYVNPEGTLNDPNGLCRWQGRWHMFYQGYPPEDPRQHWGHAVSDDLIHWRDLPYAIYPDPEYQCFSGATLVEEDRVIAMYHGTRVGNMVAVSHDPLLLNWEKVTGGPVIDIASADGSPLPYNIHDPCIWREGNSYYALSNGRRWWNPLDYLFKSEDLAHWEYLHPFTEGAEQFTLQGDDGACPYFWPIGDRRILVFFSHYSGGQYLLGDWDAEREVFVVTAGGKFNFGPASPSGVHAPSATPDGQGGIICIHNMNQGRPSEGWNQIMTLPRRLTLARRNPGAGASRPALGIEPAGDIESLRGNHQHVEPMTLAPNLEAILPTVQGSSLEIVAEVDVKGAPMFEMNVLRGPRRREYTRIAFYRERGYAPLGPRPGEPAYDPGPRQSLLTLDTSYSSLSPDALSRAPETGGMDLGHDETLKLRVFVDRSVVEVFANGRLCVAARVYPTLEESVGVSLRAQGSEVDLVSLDAWELGSVW